MKITKYEHACFSLEINEKVIIIDPGEYTTDLKIDNNVVAIIVTHAHADHFDPDKLADIYNKNPDSILISLPEITGKMTDHKSLTVAPADKVEIGPFKLEFFGGKHAEIHKSIAPISNLGVLINDTLYYPGDSFDIPSKKFDVLALPIGAPWLKISEVMDFLTKAHPKLAFPTHDAVLSEIGKSLADNRLAATASQIDCEYKRIDGLAIEI